jgi:hypothetical protein
MRQTRWQWLARFFRLPGQKQSRSKPERPPDWQATRRLWAFPVGLLIQAYTLSEARAIYKKRAGLKRLEPGTEIQRVI